jgi:hypothetical protein
MAHAEYDEYIVSVHAPLPHVQCWLHHRHAGALLCPIRAKHLVAVVAVVAECVESEGEH